MGALARVLGFAALAALSVVVSVAWWLCEVEMRAFMRARERRLAREERLS